MSGAGDEMAGIAPLAEVLGETPRDREARLLDHISRHLTARDTALRTDFTRAIERVRHQGESMNVAITDLDSALSAEVRQREAEGRRLGERIRTVDEEVRDIPRELVKIQDHLLKIATKDEVAAVLNGGTLPVAPPSSEPPAWHGLVRSSWAVQSLMFAAALFLASAAVGVLALALGSDRAGDVAADVVDKIPRYRIEASPASEPPTSQEPPPGAPPEPQP